MKTVYFTEDMLGDTDEIRKSMLSDEQDPRSRAYIRILNRPKISWIRITCFILLPAVLLFAVVLIMRHLGFSTAAIALTGVILLFLYIVLTLKRAVVCAVRIYQRYAPSSLRNKCRFEPSCSEYMILAIEKYGLIRGSAKGADRLKRCGIDGGGFDAP